MDNHPLDVPEEWENARDIIAAAADVDSEADEDASSERKIPPRVLVVGATCLGKSTFLRRVLLEKLENNALVLDVDVGRSLDSPSGSVTLHDASKPSKLQPLGKVLARVFVGDVHAKATPSRYLSAVRVALQSSGERAGTPLLVNAHGWMTKGLGVRVLQDVHRLVKPTHVVYFEHTRASGEDDAASSSFVDVLRRESLVLRPTQHAHLLRARKSSREDRFDRLATYFLGAHDPSVPRGDAFAALETYSIAQNDIVVRFVGSCAPLNELDRTPQDVAHVAGSIIGLSVSADARDDRIVGFGVVVKVDANGRLFVAPRFDDPSEFSIADVKTLLVGSLKFPNDLATYANKRESLPYAAESGALGIRRSDSRNVLKRRRLQ